MHAMFRLLLPLTAALVSTISGVGQIGIGTTSPDLNTILTISSTSKGVLIPRLNAGQQTTLYSVILTGDNWKSDAILLSRE